MHLKEFEQLIEVSVRIITMKNQLKRGNGVDFSLTFQVSFSCLVNKDSFILRLNLIGNYWLPNISQPWV